DRDIALAVEPLAAELPLDPVESLVGDVDLGLGATDAVDPADQDIAVVAGPLAVELPLDPVESLIGDMDLGLGGDSLSATDIETDIDTIFGIVSAPLSGTVTELATPDLLAQAAGQASSVEGIGSGGEVLPDTGSLTEAAVATVGDGLADAGDALSAVADPLADTLGELNLGSVLEPGVETSTSLVDAGSATTLASEAGATLMATTPETVSGAISAVAGATSTLLATTAEAVSGTVSTLLGTTSGTTPTSGATSTLLGTTGGTTSTSGTVSTLLGATSGTSSTLGTISKLLGTTSGITSTSGTTSTLIGTTSGTSTTLGTSSKGLLSSTTALLPSTLKTTGLSSAFHL
ncbi:hypothetical protein, partial [Cereibacter changlensis]|uniref:hypothetical protein n=1 Tax=Cereibacter changlensis TaxID=402884 RepID=UPI00145FB4E6